MEKTDLPCAAVRDLMPLVKDGLASLESGAIVDQHIKACPACATEWAAMRQEEPLPPESAPLDKLNKKLNRQSLERALLWALWALLAVSVALSALTHRTALSYGDAEISLRDVPGQSEQALRVNNPAAEYALQTVADAETGGEETLLTAWTTPLSRWRGASMPRSTLVTGEVWYASLTNLDVRVLPDGAESAEPSNRMTLPRLALAYYLYAAAAALAAGLIARIFIKQQNARRAAGAVALLAACYLAGHVLVMGFTTVSCFMMRDFLCILLVAALLFGVAGLAIRRSRQRAL